jgi:signal transduction histidine kinase
MRNFSIKTKLVYSHIILALGAIIFMGLLSLIISLRIFNNREEEYLNRIARGIEEDLAQFYIDNTEGRNLEDFLSLSGFQNNVALRILTPEGELFSESQSLKEDGREFAGPDDINPLTSVVQRRLYLLSLEGYTLEVLRYDDYFFHPISLLVEGMLFAALTAMVAAVLTGRFGGKRVARPIIELAELAKDLRNQKWDSPLPVSNSYELDVLAESLDRMRHELSLSFHNLEEERDVMKRFLQDASHQLRTPITALSSFLELMNSHLPGLEDRREELLEDSMQQVRKLSWIIADLLDLIRLESDSSDNESSLLSLKDSCRRAWSGLKKEAEKKSLFLDLAGPSCELYGDSRSIEMAVSNILENGIKWAPPRSRLEVRLFHNRDRYHILFRDRGPGIPKEDLPRIFDRFYRSSVAEEEGIGLGLAIVKSIMANCGGSVKAGNRDTGGAWFELIFPADGKKAE